jgi:hypothetical protein
MEVQEKREQVKKKWAFVTIYLTSTQFFISNDEKYFFHCKDHIGMKD